MHYSQVVPSSLRIALVIMFLPALASAQESRAGVIEAQQAEKAAHAATPTRHWAEELRTDMISCIRDIGVELADRALLAGDIDLARWAAARALVAAPGDELLLAARQYAAFAGQEIPENREK